MKVTIINLAAKNRLVLERHSIYVENDTGIKHPEDQARIKELGEEILKLSVPGTFEYSEPTLPVQARK